jgi:hypothetical protein
VRRYESVAGLLFTVSLSFLKFYVVKDRAFGMKLYNDQRNAHVFNLFIYLLLPFLFRDLFKPEKCKAEINR